MKQSNQLVYTLWAAAIVVCLLVSVFALFFSSCAKQKDAEGTGSGGFALETENPSAVENTAAPENPDTTPGAQETPAVSSVRLSETPDAGHAYLDNFIFLGDSTTYGIGYYYEHGYSDSLCPPTQVWTPASGTLTLYYYNIATVVYPETGEELLIVDAVERAKPEYMMLTLGVNGVASMDEEWFKRDYTALVESIREVSPDTKIILNSIYPVAANYQYLNQINNDKIRAANEWIEQVAEDTDTRYLYSFEAVVGPDGNLPEADQNGDGIHLNGDGYTKVLQYVRTHEYRS